MVLLINYEKKDLPVLEAIKEIATLFEEFKLKIGRFRQRFTILLFMSQFCYKKIGPGLIAQGKFFVKKMWEVVETLSEYNKEGASRLIRRIKQD